VQHPHSMAQSSRNSENQGVVEMKEEKKFTATGVSYYNIDNKDNKENKENTETAFLSSLGSEANASQDQVEVTPLEASSQEAGRSPINSNVPQAETPVLCEDDVARCIVTMHDNGEGTRQRYKLSITINPREDESQQWRFIGNLNKDRRIFVRNLPEHDKQNTIEFVDSIRKHCKQNHNTYPYIGKVHANYGYNPTDEQYNQKEDSCAVAVWWDGSGWQCVVKLWDFYLKESLHKEHLTPKQKRANVIAQSNLWTHPLAKSQKKRNPTFRARRQG
jgi:hypothetical protein